MNKVSTLKLTLSTYLLNSVLGHNKRPLNVQISPLSDGNAARLPIGPDTWPVPPAGSASTANQWLVPHSSSSEEAPAVIRSTADARHTLPVCSCSSAPLLLRGH